MSKESKRRTFIAPVEGYEVIIRKSRQRDFLTKGLIIFGIQKGMDAEEVNIKEEDMSQYLKDNPLEVLEIEDNLLYNCVLKPKISPDPNVKERDGMFIHDLEDEDRKYILAQINEFSGASKKSDTDSEQIRNEQLEGTSADGKVLQEASK